MTYKMLTKQRNLLGIFAVNGTYTKRHRNNNCKIYAVAVGRFVMSSKLSRVCIRSMLARHSFHRQLLFLFRLLVNFN